MNARRVEVTFSVEEWAKLEKARGRESRASFVKHHYLRALESALGGAEEPVTQSSGRAASAPTRASEACPECGAVPEGGTRMHKSGCGFVGPTTAVKEVQAIRNIAETVMSARDVLNAQRQERLNRGSVSRKGKKS